MKKLIYKYVVKFVILIYFIYHCIEHKNLVMIANWIIKSKPPSIAAYKIGVVVILGTLTFLPISICLFKII